MSDKVVNYKINYKKNCDYNASTVNHNVEIPQQNVYIDIQKPTVVNIDARKGKNGNGQFYSTLTDTYYYNEVLQVTTVVYRQIVDQYGNINHNDTPINVGKISFEYINMEHPKEEPIKITEKPILIPSDGLVTFNFIPHYDGYIRAYYYCDDDNKGFYKNTNTGEVNGTPDRAITLSKIPVYVTPTVDNIFIEKKKSVNLTCDITDIYENKINYGYITFMGYHNIDPELLVNPNEGMGVMLGNPTMVENGSASLDYSPEQDVEVEYIHGSFNYNNSNYGQDFKYYYFHNNIIRVFYIKEGIFINIGGGKLVNNQIQTIYDFDGFIHTNFGETIRIETLFNDEDFVFYDDMDMTLHIDYTQYHLKENFATHNIEDLDSYIKNNATFTTGREDIKISKNGTHKYGVPYDVNNWMPGYYSVYVSFKDAEEKNDAERQYYNDFESNKIYFAVDYPNVSLSLDDISCSDDSFTVQAGENFANYLKVKCNDSVPHNLTGYFIINGKQYDAVLDSNNNFVIKSSSLIINDIGNYSVAFATNYYYDSSTNKVYLTQFSSLPQGYGVLKVRKTLEPVINIPKGYVDNEYPGSIKYQFYINNYYDGEYKIKLSLYKNNNKEYDLDTVIYTGGVEEKIIDGLSIGKYKIRMEVLENDILIDTIESDIREITSSVMQGYIASPFDSDEEEIVTGCESTIPYILSSHKADLTNYDITNLKIYFKHEDDDEYCYYPIERVTAFDKNVYIDYNKIFYKEGKWSTYISQNTEGGRIVKPVDNNLSPMSITEHYFYAKPISAVINISKRLSEFDVYVTTDYDEHNHQVLLLEIDVSYALGENAKVYVLTNEEGRITVPFSECNDALNSEILQRQIYNIKVTVNPYNTKLVNNIKNTYNINTVKNYYDNLYASDELIEKFIKQIKDMEYCYLFSTYKKTIKSENYES